MPAPDRFSIFAWMNGYYRQVAQTTGFLEKDHRGRWAALREHILADNPPNDPNRAEAIDGVRELERADVLAWLERRRQRPPAEIVH